MTEETRTRRTWAIFFARWIVGLIFFMAGWWKVFTLGPLQHAQKLFVDPYSGTFLPVWSLWLTGAIVPLVELAAGFLLLVGYRIRGAAIALGLVLVLVTFGHLLLDPLYEFHTHVIPRAALLLFVLVMPAEEDRFTLAWIVERVRSRSGAGGGAEGARGV